MKRQLREEWVHLEKCRQSFPDTLGHITCIVTTGSSASFCSRHYLQCGRHLHLKELAVRLRRAIHKNAIGMFFLNKKRRLLEFETNTRGIRILTEGQSFSKIDLTRLEFDSAVFGHSGYKAKQKEIVEGACAGSLVVIVIRTWLF